MDKVRCFGEGNPLYEKYHDEEWGVPVPAGPDEQELFERLCLEGFQSGLSWLTVLRKRPSFRDAFAGFRPQEVAQFGDAEVSRLMAEAGIIRNRRKIEAVICNARALLTLHERGASLHELLAAHAPAPPQHRRQSWDELPTLTQGTVTLSRHLKQEGFTFVGPVTLYSTMQAIGLVDDHLAGCWLVRER